MKNARIFSVLMAVVMLVVAVLPTPAAAMQSTPPILSLHFWFICFWTAEHDQLLHP